MRLYNFQKNSETTDKVHLAAEIVGFSWLQLWIKQQRGHPPGMKYQGQNALKILIFTVVTFKVNPS